MKIAIAQINTKVGDIQGNSIKIKKIIEKAAKLDIELTVFPELSLTGYPPKDLLNNKDFVTANLSELEKIAHFAGKTACIIGHIDFNPSLKGKALFNSAALIHKGKIVAKRHKSLLPDHDIFDESKYFEPFGKNIPLEFKKQKISITICDDILQDGPSPRKQIYKNNPISNLTKTRPDIIINISASSYCEGKTIKRNKLLTKIAKKTGSHLIYCNLVGANDELIFDGNSMVFDPKGKTIAQAAAFKEELLILDLKNPDDFKIPEQLSKEEECIQALTLGIKDFFHKQGFKKAVLGMSGGIDSALVGALAVRALGKENVSAVMMPSKYTSKESTNDAKELCKNLGIESQIIPINSIHKAYSENIFKEKKENATDTAEQNIQARIRGNILMALANKNNWLVLATGNKSESAVGYCTLYGDTTGAIAPIGDILKTDVYKIAKHLNKDSVVIPQAIINKAPSAELKPNQKDQDDLPPYGTLDKIITAYIEEDISPQNIVDSGISDKKTVFSIIKKIDANEFKRKQFPLSFKVSKKSLGCCRNMPLVKDMSFVFKHETTTHSSTTSADKQALPTLKTAKSK